MTAARKKRTAMIAGALGGVALAGGLLVNTIASAQTATPTPAQTQEQQPGQPGQRGQQMQAQLAARLAQALNIPQARVEAALQSVGGPGGQRNAAGSTMLTGAAQALGVTPQQLQAAMETAMQQARQNRPQGQPGQGQGQGQSGQGQGQGQRTQGQRPDRTAFYAAIAQALGGGKTAQQVQTALENNRPTREQMQAARDQHLAQLAQALGVTTDQLKTALQSIHGNRGPGGPMGPRGNR